METMKPREAEASPGRNDAGQASLNAHWLVQYTAS